MSSDNNPLTNNLPDEPENETIVIEKDRGFGVSPKNRPRKVYAGMWGIPEIIVVGVSLFVLLATVLLYVLFVFPSKRELAANSSQRNELEKQLLTARTRYGQFTTTEEQVSKILLSVDDFETRFLRNENDAKVALYQRINGLMSAYGLVNTSGPDYAPLEILDLQRTQSTEEAKGRSKFISIFPGVYVTMTVDGSYQNLRRFVREIETSNEFIIISAVELEPSENKEKKDETKPTEAGVQNQPFNPIGNPLGNPNPAVRQPPPTGKVDRGKTHGETVTLRLEMATYYRRANFAPQTLETSSEQ